MNRTHHRPPTRAAGPGWLLAAAVLAASAGGCVPEGPPTDDAPKRRAPRSRQSAKPAVAAERPPIRARFEDRFERAELGADWLALSSVWRIRKGELCARGARNRGVWLQRALPLNARIEFDARSDSPEGDIKAESWGDGRSGASGTSYGDATSYLTILGGWRNSKHVLARLDEHGSDRLELDVEPGSQDLRTRAVVPGQTYRFAIERSDGKTVRWWVDDRLMFELADPEPLGGKGHEHFGLNDWNAALCFDNLTITPL